MKEKGWTPEQCGSLTLHQILCIGRAKPPNPRSRPINSQTDIDEINREARAINEQFQEPMP